MRSSIPQIKAISSTKNTKKKKKWAKLGTGTTSSKNDNEAAGSGEAKETKWVVRAKKCEHFPPPLYSAGDDYITVVLHYEGKFVDPPVTEYLGGKSLTIDYVDVSHETYLGNLNRWCEERLGLLGKKTYYTIHAYKPERDSRWVHLYDDLTFVEEAIRFEPDGKIDIYVDLEDGDLSSQPDIGEADESESSEDSKDSEYKGEGEGSEESDACSESLVDEKLGGEEKKDSRSENLEKEVGEGSVKDAGEDSLKDAGGDSDLVDSNYEVGDGVEDEDDAEGEEVGQKVGCKGGYVSDSDEDSGESDCVGEDDILDETRFSDDEVVPECPIFNNETTYNPSFAVGMIFGTKQDFRKAVQSHAVQTRRTLHFPKNDKLRIYAKCRAEGCDWGIHLVKMLKQESFQIRLYKDAHRCNPTRHVKNLKSSWLGEAYIPDFQCEPNRKVDGWRKGLMKKLNLNISKQQAYRAKLKALELMKGNPDEQYAKLWDYANEIKNTDEGTTVVVDSGDDGRFRGFYICFDALKKGFKSCRPFIGVDGCWLKGSHGGVLLAAVGVDPGNAIFPIAYAIVGSETKDTWGWFMMLLKSDLGISEPKKYTFMSDKQKGLIQAMAMVFPGAEHRFCVRHLHNNFQTAGYRGLAFKNVLWRAARATTEGKFKAAMETMRGLSPAAANWFANKPASEWSKSGFNFDSKCDMLLNNICESFNFCILEARDKHIITMCEWIRQWIMERLQKCRDMATKWKGKLPPKIRQILAKNEESLGECTPIKASNRYYQVDCSDGSTWAVDLELRKCSCRGWELSGIPCRHAHSAIINQLLDPEDFVDDVYSVQRYRKVYEWPIIPISGQGEWKQTLYIPPMPPTFGKKPKGRPSTKRKESQSTKEGDKKPKKHRVQKLKRRYIKITCSGCGSDSHNMRTCPHLRGESSNAHVTEEIVLDVPVDVTTQQQNSNVVGIPVEVVGKTVDPINLPEDPINLHVSGPNETVNAPVAVVIKRKRGRPAKPKEEQTASLVVEKKRKRGRPAKPMEEQTASLVVENKRKRGRPAKPKEEHIATRRLFGIKIKRGRPCKKQLLDEEVEGVLTQNEVIPQPEEDQLESENRKTRSAARRLFVDEEVDGVLTQNDEIAHIEVQGIVGPSQVEPVQVNGNMHQNLDADQTDADNMQDSIIEDQPEVCNKSTNKEHEEALLKENVVGKTVDPPLDGTESVNTDSFDAMLDQACKEHEEALLKENVVGKTVDPPLDGTESVNTDSFDAMLDQACMEHEEELQKMNDQLKQPSDVVGVERKAMKVLPPAPISPQLEEDDDEFEAMLTQASQNAEAQFLGVKEVPNKVGPTPFQQLHNESGPQVQHH